MYCKNCGNEIDKDSEFCTYCGESVEKETNIDAVSVKENTDRQKKFKKGIIVAVIIAVMVLAVFVGVWLHNVPARCLAEQLDLGNRYLDEMDYEQAVVAFTKAIEIDPMSVDAYMGAAEAYVGLGNEDEAILILEKGYELTSDEKILEMLEELRESREREGGETGEMDEAISEEDGEDELPYFELGFSPEDFTIAGYSVMDGDHLDDVEQAAAAVMPNMLNNPMAEWYYYRNSGEMMENTGERIELFYHQQENTVDWWLVGYEISGSSISIEVNASGREVAAVSEFPLYKGEIIPNVTYYEEVLDILGIRQLIEAMEETEDKWLMFESQYGVGECGKFDDDLDRDWQENIYYVDLQWEEIQYELTIGFHDNVLCSIGMRSSDLASNQ